MNDVPLGLAFICYSNLDDHLCALSKIVPSNCSSMHWIIVLVRFVNGLVLYTIFIRPCLDDHSLGFISF